MSELEALLARKATILAELAAMESKPTYSVDGQWVDHTSYRKSLLDELQRLDELIARKEGPFEVRSLGRT